MNIVGLMSRFFTITSMPAIVHKITSRIRRSQEPDRNWLKLETNDSFLLSFPRSGNTWLRHMLTLVHPGAYSIDSRSIHTVIPSLDAPAKYRPDPGQIPSPRLIKSHSLFDPRYPRGIYLLRDGRDVTYSFYAFMQKESGYGGSFYEFLVSNPSGFSFRWHEHVASWLLSNHKTPLLLIRYEEMLADPESQLHRAIDFLGWTVSDEHIRYAVAESTIDRMRAKERSGEFLAHVRDGKAGGWYQHYSKEELRVFMDLSAPTLKHFGYLASH